MSSRNVVLAGNYAEFEQWVMKNASEKEICTEGFTYLSSPMQLHGRRDFKLIYVGNWSSRPDLEAIEKIAKSRPGVSYQYEDDNPWPKS